MRRLFNKQEDSISPSFDHELEQFIEQRHRQYYEEAGAIGKHQGGLEMPDSNSNMSLGNHVHEITAKYNVLLSEVGKRYNADLDQSSADLAKSHSEVERINHEEELKETKHRLAICELELNTAPVPQMWANEWIWKGAIILLGLADGWFIAQSFLIFESSFAISLVLALICALAIAGAAHLIPRILQSNWSKNTRWAMAGFVYALVVLMFFVLAMFRIAYLKNSLGGEGGMDSFVQGLSPAYFVILNATFFTIAVLIGYFFLPTIQAKSQKKKIDDIKNKISQNTQRIESLKSQMRNIPDRLHAESQARNRRSHFQSNIKHQIETFYQLSVKRYISENCVYRLTPPPSCYNDQIPPLTNIH